jgi:hypothetical protein
MEQRAIQQIASAQTGKALTSPGRGAAEPANRGASSSGPASVVRLSETGREKAGRLAGTGAANQQLDPRELEQLQQLRQRDREVRAHEQAHVAVAGRYARGGPSYTLQRGPDGNAYAVGGKVSVDLSRENTPQATLTKMQTIKRAALAPANPSPADRQVASRATQEITRAQREVTMERQAELLETNSARGADSPPATADQASPTSGPGSAVLQARLAVYAKMAGQ